MALGLRTGPSLSVGLRSNLHSLSFPSWLAAFCLRALSNFSWYIFKNYVGQVPT